MPGGGLSKKKRNQKGEYALVGKNWGRRAEKLQKGKASVILESDHDVIKISFKLLLS